MKIVIVLLFLLCGCCPDSMTISVGQDYYKGNERAYGESWDTDGTSTGVSASFTWELKQESE